MIEEEKNWKSDEIKPAFNNDQMRQIHELCQKYDLKEIHKEIILAQNQVQKKI